MDNFEKLNDGDYAFVAVACSFEGEYDGESTHNILCEFHRVMGDFVDAEGHVSQSPIEWFVDVTTHEHFSDVLSFRKATFCKRDGRICLEKGRICHIDSVKYPRRNGERCLDNWHSDEMKRAGIALNLEGAESLVIRRMPEDCIPY